MSERQLNELTNLGELFSDSTNVIVANVGKVPFLVLSLDRITLAVNDRVLCDLCECV